MYDVVIIGSGLAGSVSALSIAKNKKVLLLTKGKLAACNSYHAQGGIAVTMNQEINEINSHIDDTYITGAKAGNLKSISELVCKSKVAIEFLEQHQVKFDGEDQEKYHFTREGGHSKHRILHAGGDHSGEVIMKALHQEIKSNANITVIEDAQALYFVDEKLFFAHDQQLKSIKSNAFVLAVGGMGSAFLTTTSVKENRGDFLTLAKSANLELENLHYQQFHPTVYYPRQNEEIFLLSEALRGEGAILRNQEGENFMPKYHKLGNLAPRDIVSRAILTEVENTNSECVYLDFTSQTASFLKIRFPLVYNHCQAVGLNLAVDLIPVYPAAHYTIGGIKTDLTGKTNQNHIYACGECASSGVHGANRLASNSLLECVVMGLNVAEDVNSKSQTSYEVNSERQINQEYYYDASKLQRFYNEILSVKRDYQRILKLEAVLNSELTMVKQQQLTDLSWFDHQNQLELGLAIIKAIKENPDSRGCHYMEGK